MEREYSPRRRTALVLAGSGTAGAYHAGVLKALDESGVKIDLVVGSGAGAVAGAFAALAGGAGLYGPGGFWDGVGERDLLRPRGFTRFSRLLLGLAGTGLVLPLGIGLLLGLLTPILLLVDLAFPGAPWQTLASFWAPEALRVGVLATVSVPVVLLVVVAAALLIGGMLRDRRRLAEALEALLDPRPALARLHRTLGALARGAATGILPERDLSHRCVALASDNFGQPGFRELILRVADLDTGEPLCLALLSDASRATYAAARSRGRARAEGLAGAVDLRAPGYERLFMDAVEASLLPPVMAPVRRVTFPRGGLYASETHRLADATLLRGAGIAEALAAGAEQVVVVTPCPEEPQIPARRRGPRALGDGVLATLERQALEGEIREVERITRMVETLGHSTPEGTRAWEDPATGRVYRAIGLYVVRPSRRVVQPLEFDGGQDPATEVVETAADLMERGHRDAYRLFVEPVVGAPPAEARPAREPEPEEAGVEL